MTQMPLRLPAALPMPQGLLAWTRAQGPEMWHELACGVDFADAHATIDLLLAAQWITRQPDCCRATALLLLARMLQAGMHDAAPPQLAPDAARVMVAHLHRRLAEGRFAKARFRLTEAQRAVVDAQLGPNSAHPLPAAMRTDGALQAEPPHAFLGWRPVAARPVAITLAA